MKKTHLSIMLLLVICCAVWSLNTFAAKYDPIVEQVQKKLTELGYDPGPADGKMGKKTEAAIKSFQKDNSLPATGKIDDATLTKLGIEKPGAPAVAEKPKKTEAPPQPTPKKEQKPKDPPKISCGYSGCSVENSLNDDLIAQIKKHLSENEYAKEVVLKNCSDADLAKLSALNDVMTKLKIERSEDISDISPIAKLTKLERLTLEVLPYLSDLTPIENLSGVVYLSIRELASPVDLAPVARLTALEEISIGDKTDYPSFDFLGPLSNLKEVFLYKSAANPEDPSDISALAGKPNLKSLSIGGTNVQDISSLKDSPELTSLTLQKSPIEDLSPLQNCPKLKYFKLISVPAKDLSPLEGMTELNSLTVYDTEVTDLTPLAALKNSLKYLNLNRTKVKDMTPVGELSELTDIFLDETEFVDFSPLAKCTKLEFLEARSEKSGFSDLNIIASMPNLKKLWLDENDKIQNWEALKTATSLTSLSIGRTSFSDLALLENLENLEDLNIYECTVKNPKSLLKLPKLTSVGIRRTKGIDDITFLKDLPSLAKLYVGYDNTQFPQEQIDALNKAQEEAKKKQQ